MQYYIGIGSNIDPEKNLVAAAARLRQYWSEIRFSHVYSSAPMENTDQPAFLNAVAAFESDEQPQSALKKLRAIENELKKEIPFRFGPRTIDLDILLAGNLVLPDKETWNKLLHSESPDLLPTIHYPLPTALVIPHPRMHKRRFVLEPLSELLSSETLHPALNISFATLLGKTDNQSCTRINLAL